MPQKSSHSESVADDSSAFKNLINAALVKNIAAQVRFHFPEFKDKDFIREASQLSNLEMKARVRHLSATLKKFLPGDYQKAVNILVAAAEKPSPKHEALSGFDLWAFTDFVQQYGLEYFEDSLAALYALTQLFTAEFAVRPFLIHSPERTMKQLVKWTQDKNHHIRRWTSEGTRPRLPWGEKLHHLIKDPKPALALLENLKYDDELYVRKSVANHLNDISKDHPELMLKTVQRWMKEAPASKQKNIQWIVRHSLRTLLKKGNPEALKILGYQTKSEVKVLNLALKPAVVAVGGALSFHFELSSKTDAQIMVDYIIHHKKARGHSAKVFKLTSKKIQAGKTLEISKKHSFKKITTRKYYPGEHFLEIMVNGKVLAKKSFRLKA